jgi:hypothetical protein
MVRMRKILTAPIATDEKVAGDEVFGNGYCVHGVFLFPAL